MTPDADDDPFRLVAIVVGGLAVLFLGVSVALQFADPSLGDVLAIPLVLLVPLIVGALYYRIRYS